MKLPVQMVSLLIALLLPGVALAHAVGVEAKLKDGKVNVEAFFDDDTPAQEAKIIVTDADGKTVAEGKTDKTGRWSFPAPAAGKYKVVVEAGPGHRATTTLTVPAPAPRPARAP